MPCCPCPITCWPMQTLNMAWPGPLCLLPAHHWLAEALFMLELGCCLPQGGGTPSAPPPPTGGRVALFVIGCLGNGGICSLPLQKSNCTIVVGGASSPQVPLDNKEKSASDPLSIPPDVDGLVGVTWSPHHPSSLPSQICWWGIPLLCTCEAELR